MITLAPTPKWHELFRTLVSCNNDLDDITYLWKRTNEELSGWLSRSAWSLALIAHWRMRQTKASSVSIWVPDYFCNQSLALLRKMGISLYFYPITPDLEPNYALIRESARSQRLDIMILVHYFGESRPSALASELCRQAGAWLIEDATHVLCPIRGVGFTGDFVMYSPHKLLALSDGALLVVRPKGASQLGSNFVRGLGDPAQWANQARNIFQTEKFHRYTVRWMMKRVLQKFGVCRPKVGLLRNSIPSPEQLPPPAMSKLSKRLLRSQLSAFAAVRSTRRRNKLLLDYLISSSAIGECFEPIADPFTSDSTPYIARYRVKNISEQIDLLSKIGIPTVMTWPDLPPEVLRQPKVHHLALDLQQTCLFLPIHQSIRLNDFLRKLPSVAPSISRRLDIAIRPWHGQNNQWSELLTIFGFSNILQASEYGDAKSRSSVWNAKRFTLYDSEQIIGCVQVMELVLGFGLRVHRINRGPLFHLNATPSQRVAVLNLLHKTFGNIWLGRLLFWAPEVDMSGENLASLVSRGLVNWSNKHWTSSVLDLTLSEEELKAGLTSSWRNSLRDAQRRFISVNISDSNEEFEFLLLNCGKMMKERQARFPAALYRELRRVTATNLRNDIFLVAYHDGKLVASIYIVVHGSTATYLVGWSSLEGRIVRAHHLLLWEGLRQLKLMSVRHFDLGGVDEEITPGIASFKLAIGGVRYRLVGEVLCY